MEKSKKPKKPTLKQQVAELEEKLKYQHAELVNYKARTEKDKAQIGKFARRDLLIQLLPIFDNIDRALSHVPEDLVEHEYIKGIRGVSKQLDGELETLGVEKIKTVGEAFDPELHEAVLVEGEGDHEEIIEEMQAGYKLNGDVVRHAMVKIKRS